jgi:serine O-acetyltransferase
MWKHTSPCSARFAAIYFILNCYFVPEFTLMKASMSKIRLSNPPVAWPLLFVLRMHTSMFASKWYLLRLFLPIMSLLNLIIVQLVYHCVFPRELRVGYRLCVPHPFGIVLSPHVTIGNNVKIMQFVTIGINEHARDRNRNIVIEDDVYIGAGAKIIGSQIRIGQGAVIGAGAVVVKSVPARMIVAGIPARPVRTIEATPTSA